jgi:hypothetical protein
MTIYFESEGAAPFKRLDMTIEGLKNVMTKTTGKFS